MGVLTTLKSISPTAAQQTAANAIGEDAIGMLSATQNKTEELIACLNQVVGMLQVGDANISTIQAIITSLS